MNKHDEKDRNRQADINQEGSKPMPADQPGGPHGPNDNVGGTGGGRAGLGMGRGRGDYTDVPEDRRGEGPSTTKTVGKDTGQ